MSEEIAAPQAELPLPEAAPSRPARPNKFIIPDDPEVISPNTGTAASKPAATAAKPVENTEDQAPSDEPKVEETEKETPEQAAKRQGRRFERRLGTAYRQAAEAKARADLAERQLAEARAASQPPKAEGEPTLAQFDYDPEKYATAKAEYAKTQAAKEFETRQRTEAQTKAQQEIAQKWESEVEKAVDKYEDFAEVVGELSPNTPFTAAIMQADNAGELAYHLGKNTKEAERIAKLQPLQQVFELGKLAAKIAAKPVEPKTPSKAPAPVTPVSGTTPASTTDLSDANVPDEVWMKRRQKQIAARRH